jgi:hypothetical protein
MSLINDALKRARHDHTPRGPQGAMPPLPPAAEPAPMSAWLVPAVVIFLIFAAIFFIGWAVAHHSVRTIVAAPPDPVVVTQQAAEVALPVIAPPPLPAPPPAIPPEIPKLQGIFYSPTAPTAIVDGKTVSLGDHYLQYRVTEITKFTVTLTDSNSKAVKLNMGD